MDIGSKAVVEFVAKTDGFEKGVNNVKKSLAGLQNEGSKMSALGDTFTQAGKALTLGITAPLVALAGGAVKQFADYEHALNGIGKTMGIRGRELEEIGGKFEDLATKIPLTTKELMGIGEIGAQLGVSSRDIVGFTKTVADMSLATRMGTEEVATGMAQFLASAGKTSVTTKNFNEVLQRTGSTIVDLGNNFGTTEDVILNTGKRLIGTAHSVGMVEKDVLGLSTAMGALGITSEQGGTAMSRVMRRVENAVDSGGKKLETFARVSGVSAQEFSTLWKKDPMEALRLFINGLGEAQDNGENFGAILKEVGISGTREIDTLARLAGGHDILNDALKRSSKAWEANTALTKEAEVRYNEVKGKTIILMNTLKRVAKNIGELLLPTVEKIIDKLQEWAEAFDGLDDKQKKTILKIAGIVAAIGPALLIIGKIIGLIELVGLILGSTAGVVILALVGIGVALYVYRDKVKEVVENVKEFFIGMKDKMSETIDQIKQFFSDWVDDMREKFSRIAEHASENITNMKTTLVEGWQSIVDGIKGVWEGFTSFMSEFWNALTEAITTTWNNLKETATTTWQGIKDAISTKVTEIWTKIVEVFTTIVESVSTKWEEIKTSTQDKWETIKSTIASVIDTIKTTVQNKWEEIKTTVTNKMTEIKTNVTNKWNEVKTAVQTKVTEILTTVKTKWEEMKTTVTNKMTEIAINTKNKWTEIKSDVQTKMTSIKTTVQSKWEEIKSTISTKVSSIKSTVSTGFSNVLTTVKTKVSQIPSAVSTAFNNAISSARRFVGSAVSAGTDLILGFVRGVKSRAMSLVNAVKGAVGNAIEGAKKLLRIGSPSKVFRKFGIWTDQGFALGIKASAKEPTKAMENVVGGVLNAYDQAKTMSIGSSINGSYQTEVAHTIRDNRYEKQPMNIQMVWGKREYYGQVDDITSTQNQKVNLIEKYGV